MEIKKTLLVALCVPALAFGIAACGDDDESSSTSTTTEQSDAPTGTTTGSGEAASNEDIVALASGNKDLSTLVTAVTAADLAETLQGEGPYTVFAPTNEAFAALPPAELERLLKPANKDELANILTYHVVAGDVKSSDLSDGQMVETVQGEKLEVKIGDDGSVMIGDATVVMADVDASNGTVHVIDAVLVPSN
ncbi:MAG: hypothetical protein QG596_805 [Actinomycetota bacterium]|jgi:uncharacterized surface protein with fasciclin (FAS1) repeats|nr:hypothetical protein [Actinomycetota bacterium]